jgi:hypothetical protein
MTMQLIETKTLLSAAASIEFTSIPQDGTDLLLLVSTRADGAGDAFIRPNGSTSGLSARRLRGNGSSAASSVETPYFKNCINTDTASTFSNGSVYFPNYTAAVNKSFSIDTVSENNATAATQEIQAALWTNTSAITSLTLILLSTNFVAGTTMSLYKITKGSDGITTVS